METPHQLFSSDEQVYNYIENVREHYRQEHAQYRGTRNEHQQLIAETTSDEARLIVDGVMAGLLALGGTVLPMDYENTTKGGHTWDDYRSEFERLLVGFGVLTHRLQRDGYGIVEYAELPESDRMKVASALFSDFQKHNALRFGVNGSGVKKTITTHEINDDGEFVVVRKKTDIDVAKNDRAISQNMHTRGYTAGVAAHQAGKISPEEYSRLRKQYPEIPKDQFDRSVSFYTNVEEQLADREA